MLSDQDLMKVQAISSQISVPIIIRVSRGGGEQDRFEVNLTNIARQISGVSMNRIGIEEETESILPGKPSLSPTSEGVRNIHYFAAPEGTEFAPFLDLLRWMGSDKTPTQSRATESLEKLATPCHLLVLMAAACPHCPQVVQAALSLAVVSPLVTVSIVDAVQFEDLARHYKVRSTPTTIIDDGLTLIGRLTAEELTDQVLRSVESTSLPSILESMIRAGRAEDAAEFLCSRDQPEAILPVYLSKEFSVRMGALVTLEEALRKNPRVLDPIVQELTALLFQEEVALRGDTAELLGKIGHPSAIPSLRKAAEDSDPDVREAVEEALQLLEH
ncbi:MAG: thioredoxin family protein [Desulfomonilaceae bacterium]